MLALDVARVEAGLLLIEVDFFSSKKALIASQKYSPFELGLRPAGAASTRGASSAARRCATSTRRGPARQMVGLEIDWTEVEEIYEELGLAPAAPATASRVAVPVYQSAAARSARRRPRPGRRR